MPLCENFLQEMRTSRDLGPELTKPSAVSSLSPGRPGDRPGWEQPEPRGPAVQQGEEGGRLEGIPRAAQRGPRRRQRVTWGRAPRDRPEGRVVTAPGDSGPPPLTDTQLVAQSPPLAEGLTDPKREGEAPGSENHTILRRPGPAKGKTRVVRPRHLDLGRRGEGPAGRHVPPRPGPDIQRGRVQEPGSQSPEPTLGSRALGAQRRTGCASPSASDPHGPRGAPSPFTRRAQLPPPRISIPLTPAPL